MTNTLINGIKNAKLKKLVNIMMLSVFLLMTGIWTASARGGDSQESIKQQQSKTQITGTVVDRTGEPIIGANIVEKGAATNGTITDVDGNFSLNVSPGATLVVSYIGYVTQEIAVGNRTQLQIVLQEDLQTLEEVVVIGYGTQKKVTLTGSVATVPVKEIANIPVSNLTAALSGKLPGVRIQQPFGTPGSSSGLSVRATGTWNNADPLYVIDGIVRDKFAFDGLNANDIDGLSVLKDASAAVYGARAANGVVLVTTKKGSAGKPVISYSGSVSISEPTKITPTQTAYEHATLYNDWMEQRNIDTNDSGWFTPDELEYYKTHNWDWLDMALRNPMINHHSLNVTGGNERVRYFIGGSYHYETGIFEKINYRTYNLRGNIEANITKDLVASLNLNMDNRLTKSPDWPYDSSDGAYWNLFRGLMVRPGFVPPYINGLAIGSPFVDWHPFELFSRKYGYDDKKYGNYEATVSLQYHIPFIEGLSVKLLYNKYDSYYFRKIQRLPYHKYQFRMKGGHNHIVDLDNPEVVLEQTRNDGNLLQEREQMDFNYQLNGFVTYNHQFGKHDVGALFVYEQAEGTTDWFQAERDNYVTGIIDQLDAGGSSPAVLPTGNGSETGRISYIGRLNYGYDSKYLLDVSFRYDGSVRFAPDKRWGFFPSALAAWRISEEQFFKDNVKFINGLKLRASVGVLGNDAVGGWQWAQRYNLTSGQYYGGSGLSTGVQAGAVPNPDITWEKSASYNGGLDATFLDSKLVLGADVFYRHTYDILGSRLAARPTTFGASMPQENYATIDTKGFELELGYTNRFRDVEYYVKGNLGYAVNKLIFQDEAENIRPYQSKIGLNTDIAMGYIATGIIRTQADLDAILAKNPNYTIFGSKPELGMLNYRDLRGPNSDTPDGVIDGNDQDWIQKHTTPPVTYGFSLGGSWKSFSLDLFFQGVGNYDVMFGTYSRSVGTYTVEKNLAYWSDHWTKNNPDAAYPRIYNNQASQVSTFWMRNGAYLRLKNVLLSYDLPKTLSDKLNLGQLRIFLEGQNLLLLEDHIKLFDPEIGNTHDNMFVYPISRSFSAGINLSF